VARAGFAFIFRLPNWRYLQQAAALKKISFKFLSSGRFWLAIFSGLLLTAAFPNIGIAGAAWIAPGLMLLASLGVPGGRAFRLGYVAGLAHFLSSLSWLLLIPYTWRGIPLLPGIGWLALGAFLALYFAAWVWLCWKIFPKNFSDSSAPINLQLDQFLSSNWLQRAAWSFFCAASWVAMEMIRARFLSGFPWNPLGASQFKILPLLQIASFTGVYGNSFLAVWSSAALLGAMLILVRRPTGYRNLFGEIALPLLVVLGVASFGLSKLTTLAPVARELKIALVQPSIPQALIWDPNEDARRFEQVMQLSEKALAGHPDVLIWPESAMSSLTKENISALAKMISAHRIWMILCSDDAEPSPENPKEINYFNASFLFGPDGQYVSKYHKQQLVIFGEYVPLARSLPFLKNFTPIEGGFTPGIAPVQFAINNPPAKISVLICFEDVFPHFAREHAQADTDFLLNLTSDAWFGHGAAQWQQAAAGLFRAVENGLPLVRCTNDGVTCWIDAQGRLREVFTAESGDIYGSGFMIVKIPLLAPGEKRVPTFYNQHGDFFGWSCVGLSLVLLSWNFFQRRKINHG